MTRCAIGLLALLDSPSARAATANPAAPSAVAAVAPTMTEVPIRAAISAVRSRCSVRRTRSWAGLVPCGVLVMASSSESGA
jgi:hypothetical protein